MEDKLLQSGLPKRNYQDSVFRMLFTDKESAIELFNALKGTDYGPDTEVQFTTLEDVLYQGVKNNLGFIIDNRFVILTEHQSTKSENMPLRQLQYITRTFETIVDSKMLFKSGLVKIPTPEFFVIYTGKEPWNVGQSPENSLELVVKVIKVVYNENEEKNGILQRSAKLYGYGLLLRYIREETEKGKELKAAIDIAVGRCMREGILTDFLRTHSAEVGTMLYDDITREEFMAIRAEEAEEIGYARGMERGKAEGLKRGMKEGLEQGLKQGIAALIEDNLEDGKTPEQIVLKLKLRFKMDEQEAWNSFHEYKERE